MPAGYANVAHRPAADVSRPGQQKRLKPVNFAGISRQAAKYAIA